MSSMQSAVRCKQCGFPEAWEEFDSRSSEWTVDCFRCGYRESWTHESRFPNGHLQRGAREIIYSAGAYCAKNADSGGEEHGGIVEEEVEQVAANIRDGIASGRLSPKSCITKFNFETREVTGSSERSRRLARRRGRSRTLRNRAARSPPGPAALPSHRSSAIGGFGRSRRETPSLSLRP